MSLDYMRNTSEFLDFLEFLSNYRTSGSLDQSMLSCVFRARFGGFALFVFHRFLDSVYNRFVVFAL